MPYMRCDAGALEIVLLSLLSVVFGAGFVLW